MFKGRAGLVIIAGATIVTLAMGIRQSSGIFLVPITIDLGIGREEFGIAIAIGFLAFGLFQPLVGALADRYGAEKVGVAGGLIFAAGLALTTLSRDAFELYLSLGVLVGIALSGTTYIVVFGAIARAVTPEQRTMAFGIATAAGSFGMFAIVPGTQWVLAAAGWKSAFLVLAVAALLMAGLGLGLRTPAGSAPRPAGQSVSEALREARGHSGYLLLVAGFFVCGFHVAFIGTHLPAYLTDNNISPAIGANALAAVGLFNIAGAYLFGVLGDRFRKKHVLSMLYLARAIVIALFLILPVSDHTALAFGAAIGFLWLGTVPLTNGLVAQIFGLRHLSMLAGFVFMSHQIGSFFGSWLGGYFYDATGSYDVVWYMAIALGVVAAILHWPIADAPLERAEYATAT